MTYPKTIQSLTENKYNELSYCVNYTYNTNTKANSRIKGFFMSTVREVLSKCDLSNNTQDNEYDISFELAVMEFQTKMGMNPTGILDNNTWEQMLAYADKYKDIIEGNAVDNETDKVLGEESPHHSSFFNDYNIKTNRRSGKDIKIVFGNNSITKTLKNVFMRSVSVEVDTSGNPISEVYEFIAQDIIESDEPMDSNKYLDEESLIDNKVKYSFSRVLKNS